MVSFLLTATDESASARNVQIACVAGAKRGGGRGEGERDPIPLPFFPSSLSPIPYPYPFRRLLRRLRSDSGDDPKENEQKKKLWGQGERERKAPFLPLPFLCFFLSALWLVPEVTQRSTKKTFLFHSAIPRTHDQRAVVDFRSR